jgi:hypothetical protein
MKRKTIVERKTMPVKGGEAWVETRRWTRRRPMRNKLVYHDLDGKPRVQREVFFMKGMTTGECPECHQMPCPHTAKLLGWPDT